MKYKMIGDADLDEFNRQVNYATELGWRPCGSPFYAGGRWCQALTLAPKAPLY